MIASSSVTFCNQYCEATSPLGNRSDEAMRLCILKSQQRRSWRRWRLSAAPAFSTARCEIFARRGRLIGIPTEIEETRLRENG
jgi:hypothetical protein